MMAANVTPQLARSYIVIKLSAMLESAAQEARLRDAPTLQQKLAELLPEQDAGVGRCPIPWRGVRTGEA
ncbi:hypothetical protein QA635_34055 [Bradyrhizobium brasilense]|uniref:hypothetical protein n=1 Tax=Bradyrhizobium brasilense TaxID=1419277 RepID=UPI0024B205E6|nr:hypothetical protein [Bradyrhizobium australafricanum]WFU31506.1 hypothetical protein QA635_34055 [Bradyrhizobium australafricanum]